MLKLNLANIKKIYKIAVVITDENCFYRAHISHRVNVNIFLKERDLGLLVYCILNILSFK